MLVFETPVPIRRAGLAVQVFLPGPQPIVVEVATPTPTPPAKGKKTSSSGAAASSDALLDIAGNSRVVGLDADAALSTAISAGGSGVCTLYLPPPDAMPHVQFDCARLLRVFSPAALLSGLAALALERRIVVVARTVSSLVETCESFLCLLYPLQFDFPYIPVLPVSCS